MELLVAEYSLRIVNIIQLLLVFVSTFGAILLWANERFRGLILLLVIQAMLMIFNFSEETGLFNQNHLITPSFFFCTGPVFFLFVKHLTYTSHVWDSRQMVHFIPAIISIPFTEYTQIVLALGTFSLIIYALFSYQMIGRYHKAAAALSSDDHAAKLSWIRGFMFVFGILMLEDTIRVNMQMYLEFAIRNSWYLFHQIAVLLAFSVLIYLAVKQNVLFDDLHTYEDIVLEEETTYDKDLFIEIDKLINEQELFRKGRLSLIDVSEASGLSIKDVSSAINNGSTMNFSEYINKKRVEYFVNNASSESSILDLALESGFNSKSSFNTLFKTYRNQTPTQYINSIQKSC